MLLLYCFNFITLSINCKVMTNIYNISNTCVTLETFYVTINFFSYTFCTVVKTTMGVLPQPAVKPHTATGSWLVGEENWKSKRKVTYGLR